MTNATFMWENLWDIGSLSESSQASNFPSENTQRRWATEVWRSNYGAGSGGGNFLIESGVNDKIDFEETASSELTATLTPGAYTADGLASQIETQLESAGASGYTVTYSDSTWKFTLTSDGVGGGGIFKLLWSTGTNSSTSVGSDIGFDVTGDDSGALTYTGDNVAIHTEEWIVNNLGSAQNVQAFLFKKHNLTNTATAKIQANASDAWSSPSVDVTLSVTADITIYFWSSAQSYQYWRHYIQDVDNDDGYVEFGRMFLGGYFSPEVNFRRNYKRSYQDPSKIHYSDGGQISTNKYTKYKTLDLVFEYTSDTDLVTFEEMWDTLGFTEEFFFTRDRDKKSTTTTYMKITSLDVTHIARDELYTVTVKLEGLR